MRLFRSDTSKASAPSRAAQREPGSRRSAIVATVATIATLAAAVAGAQLQETLQAQVAVDKAAQQSQQRVNATRDKTLDAAARYAQAMSEAESYEKYNKQLTSQVQEQVDEIGSIEQQLQDIETTNREVQPLMQQMVDTLDEFVSLDVPFLLDERTKRVDNLKNLMTRADVTISEKYRLILEAYQIELEYGRTLGAYQGVLGSGDTARTVRFARLGRVALMYRTIDGSESGYWDIEQDKWVVDNSYSDAVELAIRVANQDGAPELLIVPVPAPQEVRS